ncbi:recombination regulator RecX [Anoxybacteroides tepidamans]|uniref:recombination regulator RecX n=1 Tax=Anoxybacteroides tepidamans TaxID=265948 RepID=UPI001E4BE51F|nr:recombination regulator RecX [Anoxybacillus tepidamans]
MLITKVAVHKDDPERFMISALKENGESVSFSVDQDVLIEFRLKKGTEIDEFTWQEIVYADEVKKAYHAALYFLAYRMRSEKEMIDYLKKKGISEAVVRDVLHKLRKQRYIDDREFAFAFVRTQMKTTLKGPNVIRKELEQFGISGEMIEESLQMFTFDKQLEAATKLYEKTKKKTTKRSAYQWKQYMEQLLQRKGFSRSVIDEVLNDHQHIENEEKEWEALEYHARKAHRRYQGHDRWTYEQKMKQSLYRKGFSIEKIEKVLEMLKDE